MEDSSKHLHQALQDLATIRRAVERARPESSEDNQSYKVTLGVNFIIQAIGGGTALLLLIMELSSNNAGSKVMLQSVARPELQLMGITNVALMLAVFSLCLYYLIYQGARKSKESFSVFVARSFQYLKNMSFLSDLLVKYTFFVVLIVSDKPEWVAPVFMLFIGDYLIQGRYFTLPVAPSIFLGILSIIGGTALYMNDVNFMTWPLATFVLISGCSIVHLLRLHSADKNSME